MGYKEMRIKLCESLLSDFPPNALAYIILHVRRGFLAEAKKAEGLIKSNLLAPYISQHHQHNLRWKTESLSIMTIIIIVNIIKTNTNNIFIITIVNIIKIIIVLGEVG